MSACLRVCSTASTIARQLKGQGKNSWSASCNAALARNVQNNMTLFLIHMALLLSHTMLAGEPVVAHPPYSLQTTQQCHCKQQVYSAPSQMSVPWRMAHIQMNECLLMVQGLDRPHAEQRLWQAWQAGRSRWCPRHDSGQAHVPGLPDPGPDSSQCLAHFCSQD